jgi:tRNA uridine 5-carboxymethylaminomethyl modification enzyme
LLTMNETPISEMTSVEILTKRATLALKPLLERTSWAESIGQLDISSRGIAQMLDGVVEQAEIEIKYSGYIERQLKEISVFAANEEKHIPETLDYAAIKSLSTEARQKLAKIRPASLGQASRIQGVSASDVSVLTVFLR